jgi:hypothetical protein
MLGMTCRKDKGNMHARFIILKYLPKTIMKQNPKTIYIWCNEINSLIFFILEKAPTLSATMEI